MNRRVWIRSGIEEELDERQQRLLDLVIEKIRFYYAELYQTKTCYQYPLSLSLLMKLTKRNSYAVLSALRVLANTIDKSRGGEPSIFYNRTKSERNKVHRPYRIFLRQNN